MRLMTGREAINELNDIINDTDHGSLSTTIHCNDEMFATDGLTTDQLNRIRFLIDYVYGELPTDPDFEAMQRRGILV